MTITLPDGSSRQFPDGATGMDIAEAISPGLARAALAVDVNGDVRDLNRPVEDGSTVGILTWESKGGQMAFWHSSAHLMAEALEALYPGVKFGIGPPIEGGFYYDVDLGDRKLTAEDLEKIEHKMIELAREDSTFERREVSKQEALDYFTEKGDDYKLELIEDLEDGTITFYQQGDFVDLCKGPHIPSTKPIKAVKLLNIAGAYWRGDETRPQLTRLYGVTFPKQKMLEEHLERLELAKQRDHRKLGRELGLFMFSQRVGPGLPMWLPKGAILRDALVDFLKEEQIRRGYLPVITPHIGRLDLFRTSGHYPYYADSQFPPMFEEGLSPSLPSGESPDERSHEDDDERHGYLLKPMNCPHHTQIYDYEPRSYRDLPIRLAEFGQVYRFEQSGELGGLTRVRGFTVDDAHLFCMPEQVKDELKDVIDLTLHVFSALDFHDFKAQVSLRDPDNADKYIGEAEQWDQAEQAIREAASEMGLETVEEIGEAAFYGPKLDFMVKDALGREWQLGTVQLDYNLPERFDLWYTDANDEKQRPVMIHRAPFGSLERFIGVLIEHSGGNFPTWLAPVQVKVLPVSDGFIPNAEKIGKRLLDAGVRVEVDRRSEKVGRKIRDAEVEKVPYMLIIGQKEVDSDTVSVRRHGEGDLGALAFDAFIERLKAEISDAIASRKAAEAV
ncbi:MAG: threonine--tRNA ligase [Rubricoccaceae bacterium]|nr:threonine--tRNA ligase [Rubricoccaceae bacterium]